jgi:hypothetical protein
VDESTDDILSQLKEIEPEESLRETALWVLEIIFEVPGLGLDDFWLEARRIVRSLDPGFREAEEARASELGHALSIGEWRALVWIVADPIGVHGHPDVRTYAITRAATGDWCERSGSLKFLSDSIDTASTP